MKKRLQSILFNKVPVKGCGTGIFIWRDKYFEDICIAHDEEWDDVATKTELLGLDLRYSFLFLKRAIEMVLWGLVGVVLYGLLMPIGSIVVYLIKPKDE